MSFNKWPLILFEFKYHLWESTSKIWNLKIMLLLPLPRLIQGTQLCDLFFITFIPREIRKMWVMYNINISSVF